MEVRTASKEVLEQIIAFNTRIYPNKKIPAKDYLRFWVDRSKDALEQCLVLQESDGAVFGQILASSMSYYYKHQTVNTVWLFDLIVDEEFRKGEWGIDLLLACMEKHPASCSTGSGPLALPIHLKMGNKVLGEIRKYVGITNCFHTVSSFKKGLILPNRFPEEIRVGDNLFKKQSKEDMPDLAKPFNEDLLEIARDKEFLQWRYYSDLHQYAFYKNNVSDDFFVVRTTVQKGMTVMLLVDYRCSMTSTEGFSLLFEAVKRLMKAIHVGILIVGSSLQVVDQVLETNRFRSVGRPRPVIGFVRVKERAEDIQQRNFVFATLADSDGETNLI